MRTLRVAQHDNWFDYEIDNDISKTNFSIGQIINEKKITNKCRIHLVWTKDFQI